MDVDSRYASAMGHIVYRFGDHTLDPASRELRHRGEPVALPPKSFDCLVYLIENRERAVGRDELISAVWGRVDASDAVVSQTLLRARRAIGDTGAEQSVVRTVPRFGYHWIAAVDCLPQSADTSVAEQLQAVDEADAFGQAQSGEPRTHGTASAVQTATSVSAPSSAHNTNKRRWRRWTLAALAMAIVLALLAFGMWWKQSRSPAVHSGDLALVLPVQVTPGAAEHAWIRLGAMDYIASLLRRNGRLTVLPSEQTLRMVGARELTPDTIDRLRTTTRARWILQPSATAVPQGWRMRIQLATAEGVSAIEGRGQTPLEAAAAASSVLLHRIGRDSPSAPAPTALTQRLQQIDAELLTGRLDAARRLIQDAPATQRDDPQLRVREGQLEFRAGRLDAAKALFDKIVKRQSALPVELRSQALMGLGAVALRRGDAAEGERFYGQAVRALETDTGDPADPALLGHAYNGLGVTRVELGRIDEAIADLGRARIAMQRAGDEVEAASVGTNIGKLESRRGNANQAVQEFDHAIATFERFDVRDSQVVALLSRAEAQLQLLQPAAALTDSRRAMQLGRTLENPQLRAYMAATHARVLLDNGRLQEAEALLRGGGQAPAGLRLRLLLERGHFRQAHALAADLLEQPDASDADTTALLPVVQAALAGNDAALARRWQQTLSGEASADDSELSRALVAGADRDLSAAGRHYDAALTAARQAAPAAEARVGAAMVIHLVAQGDLDRASAVMGGLSTFADRDYRVARASLVLADALGDRALQARAQAQVRKLAGERDPALPVVF